MKSTVPRGTARAFFTAMFQAGVVICFDHILPCISSTYALRSRRSQGSAPWANAGVARASRVVAAQRVFVSDMSSPHRVHDYRSGSLMAYGPFRGAFRERRRLTGM